MLHIPTMFLVGGLLTGHFDAYPELLLGLRCQRLPGESDIAYVEREVARIDAIMQRSIAENARELVRLNLALTRCEESMKECFAKKLAKRNAEAEALKALGGGVADHPLATFTAPAVTVETLLEQQKQASQQRVDAKHKASREEAARVLEDVYRLTAEIEQRKKERRERTEKKPR